VERAVFLLREVFDYGYDEIAGIVERSEPNCRQIYSRARKRIDEGKPRFEADRAKQRELASRFFAAVQAGDMDPLVELLADDVVFVGDGGGKGRGLPRPIYGRVRVQRLLAAFLDEGRRIRASSRPASVNGQPALLNFDANGRLINVFVLDIAGGAIQAIRSIINPDKLGHLGYPLSPVARGDLSARDRSP
jgi:RNA polymerase sigma-70 factor (ECF subfamily)